METNIIKVKKMKDGLFILIILRQLKLHQIGTCGCTIQLTRFLIIMIKNIYGKKHLENQTGTNNSFKPVNIKKNGIKKI